MSSLSELMEDYIEETKGRIDFNSIPEQVVNFTRKITTTDLEKAYRQLTHKKSVGRTHAEMANELIFMLLNYKREMF